MDLLKKLLKKIKPFDYLIIFIVIIGVVIALAIMVLSIADLVSKSEAPERFFFELLRTRSISGIEGSVSS